MEKGASLLAENAEKAQRMKDLRYNRLKKGKELTLEDKKEELPLGVRHESGVYKIPGRVDTTYGKRKKPKFDAQKRVDDFKTGKKTVGKSNISFSRAKPLPAGPDRRFWGDGAT